jgi:hypothetical protein
LVKVVVEWIYNSKKGNPELAALRHRTSMIQSNQEGVSTWRRRDLQAVKVYGLQSATQLTWDV